MVARWVHTPKVVGSSPSPALFWGISIGRKSDFDSDSCWFKPNSQMFLLLIPWEGIMIIIQKELLTSLEQLQRFTNKNDSQFSNVSFELRAMDTFNPTIVLDAMDIFKTRNAMKKIDCRVDFPEDFQVSVNLEKFLKIVKNFKDSEIEISYKDSKLTVKGAKASFSLPVSDVSLDFLQDSISSFSGLSKKSLINSLDFAKAINSVTCFVKEVGNMDRVKLQSSNLYSTLNLVGTDSFVLSYYQLHSKDAFQWLSDTGICLAKDDLEAVAKALEHDDGNCFLGCTDSIFIVQTKDLEMQIKRKSDDFVSWESILRDKENGVILPRKEFKEMITSLKPVSDTESKQGLFSFENDLLSIETDNEQGYQGEVNTTAIKTDFTSSVKLSLDNLEKVLTLFDCVEVSLDYVSDKDCVRIDDVQITKTDEETGKEIAKKYEQCYYLMPMSKE